MLSIGFTTVRLLNSKYLENAPGEMDRLDVVESKWRWALDGAEMQDLRLQEAGIPTTELERRVGETLKRLWSRMRRRKPTGAVDVRTLSGGEWLRLLVSETSMVALTGWCPSCRSGATRHEITCGYCGHALLAIDDAFWNTIGEKIRRAIRHQKFLVNQIKAERENLYGPARQPQFPAQLGWLASLWEQTRGVPHASFDARRHYSIANVLRDIRGLGVSRENLIEILKDEEPSSGRLPQNRKKKNGKFTKEVLREVKELFVGFFGYTGHCEREWRRTIKWVDRQRDVPMSRLRGERPRS